VVAPLGAEVDEARVRLAHRVEPRPDRVEAAEDLGAGAEDDLDDDALERQRQRHRAPFSILFVFVIVSAFVIVFVIMIVIVSVLAIFRMGRQRATVRGRGRCRGHGGGTTATTAATAHGKRLADDPNKVARAPDADTHPAMAALASDLVVERDMGQAAEQASASWPWRGRIATWGVVGRSPAQDAGGTDRVAEVGDVLEHGEVEVDVVVGGEEGEMSGAHAGGVEVSLEGGRSRAGGRGRGRRSGWIWIWIRICGGW
jgi:hypothetical protein